MQRKAHQPGAPAWGMALRYNCPLASGRKQKEQRTMEAERINAIGNKIADLAARGDELRRYL